MMVTPHITPVPHAGASPYAPVLTPSEQHAAGRCAVLTDTERTAPVAAVDVWGALLLEDSL